MFQLRRFLTVQTLLIAVVAFGAPVAALAQVPPGDPPPSAPTGRHVEVISQSSPLWTFVVVAAIACLVTAGAFLAGIRYRHHLHAATA